MYFTNCVRKWMTFEIFLWIFSTYQNIYFYEIFLKIYWKSLYYFITALKKKIYSYIPSDNLCLILFWSSVESIICIISHCYRLIELHHFNQFYQYLFKDVGLLFFIEVMLYHSCLSFRLCNKCHWKHP